ncbi:MAG TPA: shikimate kinase [Candidatus Acidoferrales bacterium]|nr:shikimate kinase [Candidatus Acidoferrales bacterium]
MVQSTFTSVTDASSSKDFVSAPSTVSQRPRLAHKLIALTGFMGCGKSTVARHLAKQIGWIHSDLDKRIVERTGLSVQEIFARHGEASFREMEHEELKRILGEAREFSRPTIVSLGGGTIVQDRNLELLRQSGCPVVWLYCNVEELLRRCSHITNRPLFRDAASFRQLYEQRLPFYEKSDFRVESSVEPLRVVQQIIDLKILEGVPV